MVKRSKKRTILAAIIVIMLVITGISLYYIAYIGLDPERLNAAVTDRIQKDFGGEVSIGSTSIEIFKGPQVFLSDISVKGDKGISFKARSISAKFSPWYLVLGRFEITGIRLVRPDASIRAEDIEWMKTEKGLAMPFMEMEEGSVKVVWRGRDISFEDADVSINEDGVRIEANILGGRTEIEAEKYNGGWKGYVEIDALPLEKIVSETKGMTDIDVSFDVGETIRSASVGVKTRNLYLPWSEQGLDEVTLKIDAKGDEGNVALTGIEIATSLLKLQGRGEISGLDGLGGIKEALLDIEMESSEFDYEKVCDFLPMREFPDWLSLLLTCQIREGNSRFSEIRYKGAVGDVTDGERFTHNLYVVEDLIGQSFGACHGPERISNISGAVVTEKGNIILRDLSGYMGESKLESVNITFVDIINPGDRVLVDVELDMNATDFLDTWRAAMTPEDVHDLLDQVSQVNGGRIQAKVRTYSDSMSEEPTKAEGEIVLDDCSFNWGDTVFRNITGSLEKEKFDSSLKTDLSGRFGDLSLAKLDLVMGDPFGDASYSFSATVTDVPNGKKFYFDEDADILVTGTGRETSIKGKIKIKSNGFSILGTHYRPLNGDIEGTGTIEGIVLPDTRITIKGLNLAMEPGKVTMDYGMKDTGGSLNIKGNMNLNRMQALKGGDYCILKGKIKGDARVSWDDAVSSVEGYVNCDDALFCYKDSFFGIDGPVKLGRNKLSSDKLRIRYDDLSMDISGGLAMGQVPHFTGDLAIDGIKIKKSDEGITKGIGEFTAVAKLKLTNMEYHGIPVDSTVARLILRNGKLRLDRMVMHTMSGIVQGKASIPKDGKTTFDMDMSFENVDMGEFLNTLYPGRTEAKGPMNLKGRLWGNADSINGDLVFSAQDGYITKYYLISKIFTVLNVYRIVKKKKVDLLSEGFPYESITSTFTIRDGIMNFDDFYLDSDSVQMSAVGKYSLKERQVDALIGMQPLETVDRIISSVPFLGWVMTGEDGRLVVVTLKIRGDIRNPVVTPQPLDTLSTPVKGIFERSLKLPAKIITNPEKIIPGIKK